MPYRVKPYTTSQAKKYGLIVKPSKVKGKKIDVYKNGKKIGSVGAIGYSDYPTYMETHSLAYAERRRKLYKQRHEKTRHKKYSNSWLADKLLGS